MVNALRWLLVGTLVLVACALVLPLLLFLAVFGVFLLLP